jgi:isocitrate dehydrogenase
MKPTSSNARADARNIPQAPTNLLQEHDVQVVDSPAHDLYDRLADRFSVLYQEGMERTREAMDVALVRAKEELATAGEFSQQQGEVLAEYLKRDLEQTALEFAALRRNAQEKLHPARLGAGAMVSLSAALEWAGETLQQLAKSTDATLVYRTGEITGAGTLTCGECGGRMRFKKTGTVPPCPYCGGTDFKRSY